MNLGLRVKPVLPVAEGSGKEKGRLDPSTFHALKERT